MDSQEQNLWRRFELSECFLVTSSNAMVAGTTCIWKWARCSCYLVSRCHMLTQWTNAPYTHDRAQWELVSVSANLHYTATDMLYNTIPTDKLTTILQLVVQQICHIAMPEPNISTCQDVGMWQIFVSWWRICCTTSCRIVVACPLVVLYNMSVAGVRAVEFGTDMSIA